MQKEKIKWEVTIIYLSDIYPKIIARVDSLKRAIRIAKSFEKQSGLGSDSKFYPTPIGDKYPSGEIAMSRILQKDGKDFLAIRIDEDKFSSSFKEELNRIKKLLI